MWIVLYCYETTCKEDPLPFADHLIGLVSRMIEFRNSLLDICVFSLLNSTLLLKDAHLIHFKNTENDAFKSIIRKKH